METLIEMFYRVFPRSLKRAEKMGLKPEQLLKDYVAEFPPEEEPELTQHLRYIPFWIRRQKMDVLLYELFLFEWSLFWSGLQETPKMKSAPQQVATNPNLLFVPIEKAMDDLKIKAGAYVFGKSEQGKVFCFELNASLLALFEVFNEDGKMTLEALQKALKIELLKLKINETADEIIVKAKKMSLIY